MRVLLAVAVASISLNLGLLFMLSGRRQADPDRVTPKEQVMEKTWRIAILKPVSVKVLDKIADGFIDTLAADSSGNYECIVFDANNDATRMRSQVEHVLADGFDLAFTIGASCTTLMKERAEKEGSSIPIIMSAVRSDGADGILSGPVRRVTGIVEGEDPDQMVSLLSAVKPDTRRVLIVYSPATSGMEGQATRLTDELAERDISAESVEVYALADIGEKVGPLLGNGYDVLISLPDPITTAGEEQMIKLCDLYGVSLFAPNFEAVENGAVMGFGAHTYDQGVDCAAVAREILVDGKKPHEIPLMDAVTKYSLLINRQKAKAQNIHIDRDLQLLIERAQFLN